MTAVRPALLSDLPQMIALDREIFGAYGAQEKPEVIRSRLEAFPAGCVVLETERKRAGVLTFLGYLTTEKWLEAREPALGEDAHQTHRPAGRILCITTLVVAKQAQKRGLGRQLLAEAIAIARREGCEQIILETARARRFYRRHGFELIGQRTQRGVTLDVMRLKLLNKL